MTHDTLYYSLGADKSHFPTPWASAFLVRAHGFYVHEVMAGKLKARSNKSFENLFVSPCSLTISLVVPNIAIWIPYIKHHMIHIENSDHIVKWCVHFSKCLAEFVKRGVVCTIFTNNL